VKIIKNVDILSFAKIHAAVGFLFGMFMMLPFVLFGIVFIPGSSGHMDDGPAFGLVTIIVFPLIYGAAGFIGGAIFGFIWNLAVKITGGIKVNIEGIAEAVE